MDYLLNDDKSDNNLARKIFIFSNPEIFLLSCPPPCGHFLIPQSTAGGVSYKVNSPELNVTLACSLIISLLTVSPLSAAVRQ